jgi:hypothetical protein
MLDWGNVPAWVGSTLTGTSLLIASVSYRQNVVERTKKQAVQVTAWFTPAGEELDAIGTKATEDTVFVRNASDAAVYLVVLNHDDGTPGTPPQGVSTWRSIGPQTTVSTPSLMGPTQLLPSALTFVDATGRPWRRQRTGVLSGPKRRQRSSVISALERYF